VKGSRGCIYVSFLITIDQGLSGKESSPRVFVASSQGLFNSL
jgi:hypothetical protein